MIKNLLLSGWVLAAPSCTQPKTTDCTAMAAGIARDQCLHAILLQIPADNLKEVQETAALIEDPIIQQASLVTWVRDHVNEIPREKGEELCALLDGQVRAKCQRQLSSPHLQQE